MKKIIKNIIDKIENNPKLQKFNTWIDDIILDSEFSFGKDVTSLKSVSFIINIFAFIFICCVFLTIFVFIMLLSPLIMIRYIKDDILFYFDKYINIIKKQKYKENMKKYLNDIGETYVKKEGFYRLTNYNLDSFKSISLENFIINFFNTYNDNSSTKGSNHFCSAGRRRSLGDLFLICKNYYPNCTFYEIVYIVKQLINSNKIRGSYCTEIKKFVFRKHPYGNYLKNQDYYPEFSNIFTMKEIFDLI